MDDRRFLSRLVLSALAAAVVGIAWQAGPSIIESMLTPPPQPRQVDPRPDLPSDERSVIETFQAARESVVFITTSSRVIDPWSRRSTEVPRGTGSGFVWDAQGHVITNNHVIAGADGALVQLADGETYQARLVGTDPAHDLAVLRIEGGDAPPLLLGRSADIQVGQKVLAIGNPFGLDWTLTTGVVSALDREFPGEGRRTLRGLIQTDAAINPGNSGGPLLDSAGRLIGVNTAIFSPSGGSAGIGFAVPVDVVNRVVPQLIEHGRYTPPALGIDYDQRINELARRQGLAGVVVLGVVPGSGAERAGLEPARFTADGRLVPGDIVVGVGGSPVVTSEDLLVALDTHEPGDQVEIELLRNGRQHSVTVALEGPA
ncbi:serine protease, S1-C subfamily, contains C-terminal PDZ domain [Palleronia marisminoris]|uniref:Putative periplasmic serine endoprotease DegP-like n=1 Tax=Palleronia marisminoris TaxID=315423 RepID=A0A1Y5TU09_9RHOB|nr:trypsin-like peptidase domain-containing protein [Palleronia marisminoris]SFH46154.1 serine protease, S1-C subfamily, contains C-terminal PDZ domain [Palleronia marisminoris]SLN68251.1 putative periplasmic serine endoprotease DegP-like precursor [Palleronia marisminoris]